MNVSVISKPINSIIKSAACNQRVVNLTAKMAADENLYSKIALASILAKIVNGKLFSSFSYLKNKKLPEEQRKFLAFQELALCGMAAATTIFLDRFLKVSIRDFMTTKCKPVANWLKKLPADLALETKKGIGIGSTLAAIIIANRIIIPYLSIPITKYLKEHFAPKSKDVSGNSSSQNLQNSLNKKEFIV